MLKIDYEDIDGSDNGGDEAHFPKAIAFAWWPFSPIFKIVSFFQY